MKTVYFIRHAKSSWADMSLRDEERPLNNRGLRDAPFMAKMFKAKELMPDVMISSPAVRAHTTARFFAAELGIKEEDIRVYKNMYLASEDYVIGVLNNLDDGLATACVFGHNPTTTNLANIFHDRYLPNVPTCGIVKVQAEVESWAEFLPRKARLVDFHYPKQYFE